ncbi:MAG: LysM peptidoglycan-binding domain-containing protein [Actinobacteria bacterium]|nr:MAG: LysM peptidoglycan-binding domain-containing protein [Actinomycetota bacterium]
MFVKLIALVLAGLVVWSIAAHSSDGAGRPQLYTVKRYDTLWSIASSHYGGDPRAAIYRLEERNGLAGDIVQPGQKLVLP